MLDGFISCSAALVVRAIEPEALDNVLFAHCSAERGHRKMLDALGADRCSTSACAWGKAPEPRWASPW